MRIAYGVLAAALAVLVLAVSVAGAAVRLPADLLGPDAAVLIQSGGVESGAVAGESLSPANELAGSIDPRAYRIGPGDLLVLHFRGQVSRSVQLEVGPEGTIMVPDEGMISVAGRTLTDVRADVLQRMHRRYRNIEVDFSLSRPRTFRIYLTGQVKMPGPASANGAYRVADVLTTGMLLEGASRRRVEVLHVDGSRDACDLDLFLQTGSTVWNPWLRDGDVVQVPTATRFVHVEGAVARPGRYELGQRDSLRTLLRLSGEPLPAAITDRALVVRFRGPAERDSQWVSLDDVLAGRSDLVLENGERLYVYYLPKYRLQQQAVIVGEVQRPGTYPVVEGHTRLSGLVTAAQGFQPDADLSALRVHRGSTLAAEKDQELDRLLRLSRNELTASEYEVLRTKLAGLREDYRVDWTQLQKNAEIDLLLRDGDIVRVERLVSSIRVDGEVRRPGLLNFVRGQSVSDCVEQAGGFTDRAWRGKVRVTRAVTGQTLLARNVRTLDPGDFVWVPERPDVTGWQQAREMITALAQVATIVIAIRSVR